MKWWAKPIRQIIVDGKSSSDESNYLVLAEFSDGDSKSEICTHFETGYIRVFNSKSQMDKFLKNNNYKAVKNRQYN